jgi:hypothetical protein
MLATLIRVKTPHGVIWGGGSMVGKANHQPWEFGFDKQAQDNRRIYPRPVHIYPSVFPAMDAGMYVHMCMYVCMYSAPGKTCTYVHHMPLEARISGVYIRTSHLPAGCPTGAPSHICECGSSGEETELHPTRPRPVREVRRINARRAAVDNDHQHRRTYSSKQLIG